MSYESYMIDQHHDQEKYNIIASQNDTIQTKMPLATESQIISSTLPMIYESARKRNR